MKKEYPESEIISGCLKGDSEYQRALVMQYSELLNGTALRYVKDQDVAKDILQESFIRIFKYLSKVDLKKGSLTSWMCRIVINESIKVWKSQKTKVDFNEYFDKVAERPLVLDSLAASEIYQYVLELEDPYRVVFNLNVIEGYKHKEIAEILGMKTPTSRSILSRAKEMIRKKITKTEIKESWI